MTIKDQTKYDQWHTQIAPYEIAIIQYGDALAEILEKEINNHLGSSPKSIINKNVEKFSKQID